MGVVTVFTPEYIIEADGDHPINCCIKCIKCAHVANICHIMGFRELHCDSKTMGLFDSCGASSLRRLSSPVRSAAEAELQVQSEGVPNRWLLL